MYRGLAAFGLVCIALALVEEPLQRFVWRAARLHLSDLLFFLFFVFFLLFFRTFFIYFFVFYFFYFFFFIVFLFFFELFFFCFGSVAHKVQRFLVNSLADVIVLELGDRGHFSFVAIIIISFAHLIIFFSIIGLRQALGRAVRETEDGEEGIVVGGVLALGGRVRTYHGAQRLDGGGGRLLHRVFGSTLALNVAVDDDRGGGSVSLVVALLLPLSLGSAAISNPFVAVLAWLVVHVQYPVDVVPAEVGEPTSVPAKA
jgi:hypothetical protein